MAIRPTGGSPDAPQERAPAQDPAKKPPSSGNRSQRTAGRPAPKPGQIGHEDEHDHHAEAQQLKKAQEVPPEQQQVQALQKPAPAEALKKQRDEDEARRREGGGAAPGGGGGGGGGPTRAEQARSKGFQTTPGLGDFVRGQAAPKGGSKFAEVLPGTRVPASPLPEPELRPPIFLSPFEGMKDIYLRVKGRASPKTRELLEGPHLEDLVKMVIALSEDEKKSRAPEARVSGPLYAKLRNDPGPILTGLNDPRLKEPWRLFLEGWEVWTPDDKTKTGVELFLEGEGEDDHGEPIEILQVLRLVGPELTLDTKLGALRDVLCYDGEAFYRLKADRDAR